MLSMRELIIVLDVEELHFYSNASYERREYANFHNFPAVSYICSRSASTRQIFCDFSVLFQRDFHEDNITAK